MNMTRVLIVDDVDQVRFDLGIALALSGDLEIVGEAADGLEAVRLTERLNPDVVLMDLGMPVMDGYEATQWIKTKFPLCKVVALTVHGYDEAREKACQSGVDAFLVKGAQIQEIVQTILGIQTLP
jgi:DNA-binding NarL/FixJ family response regulator